MRFVLASGNAHKLIEFRGILAPHDVVGMAADINLPPEGADSFRENAAEKARALAGVLDERGARGQLWCLADDSGLEVEALNWQPGVLSARFAGESGSGADAANVAKLLRELRSCLGPAARRARFVCSLVAIAPDGSEYAADGRWWGSIADEPRGVGGFGYDPVFEPEGSERTVAEWSSVDKDRASHRALAARALLDRLRAAGVVRD